ncbi:MAG TPA: DUF4192 domain-containing protein [Flexivirga sp.]|uniref:DUF4192 domain-containing protein n=1 Tax=Flexivirga sp. TaxID=1962927 RepID=UPI002D1A1DA0|nr:DUF4192 domain-containing protein [Flexivirga sp.]HWC20876.1 DUF4192 domain-containing protein [Flexivirga sp.]
MTSQVSGIGEIIALLPYELGFVPADSLALVGIHDGQLAVTARLNRPDPLEVVEAARQMAAGVARSHPDELIVLCYGGYLPGDGDFVDVLRWELDTFGVEVSHVASVHGTQWRADQCTCGCCPRELVALPAASSVAPVAEHVLRGVVPAPSRDELRHRFDLRHPLVAHAVGRALSGRSGRCAAGGPDRAGADALRRILCETEPEVHRLPVEVLAAATSAVARVGVRDYVLAWLMPDFLSQEQVLPDGLGKHADFGPPPLHARDEATFSDPAADVAARLGEWVACIPREHSVPVLMLVAGIQWTTGSGVLATFAVERALDIDPDCRLAQLFAAALHGGLRPHRGEQRSA